MRISKFISMVWQNNARVCWFAVFALVLTNLCSTSAMAQTNVTTTDTVARSLQTSDSIAATSHQTTDSVATDSMVLRGNVKTIVITAPDEMRELQLFEGVSASADVFGPLMSLASSAKSIEGALKVNMYNKYFPTIEIGLATYSNTDYNTKVKYNTTAPFMRIGCDVNLLKNKHQDNRLFVGLRYGLSAFKYDLSAPEMTDPIWGGSGNVNFDGISCTSHWLEVVFGVQVKVYKNFHMGWSVRYKNELSSSKSDFAHPAYIPGYGSATTGSCWGATYNLIFDLNWGKRKAVSIHNS